jgi:predicted GH43/DUF377 family glycosyl hydrolase
MKLPLFATSISMAMALRNTYNVTVLNRNPVLDHSSLISRINGSSTFNYSFNTAWFEPPSSSTYSDGLIVRVVECNPNHHSCFGVDHPEWTNAGALAVIRATLSTESSFVTEKVSIENISWVGINNPPPHGGSVGLWGLADPRMSRLPSSGEYFLTFDNCTANCYPHRTTLLSTTFDPFNSSAWVFRGPLLGADAPYSGGASLLLRDSPPHYAFVGNSNTANVINLATSQDGYTWKLNSTSWMKGRPGMWDASGVAAGPGVERLSTGDYLFIYNIDTGFPYHPSYLGRCAVGWSILDGNDPSIIISRASAPLLTSTYYWETCGGESGKGPWPMCQEPLVVFATGLKPLGNDQFLIIYGAADSVVGVAQVEVTMM